MKNKTVIPFLLMLVAACLTASCEKMSVDSAGQTVKGANVVVRVQAAEPAWSNGATRALVPISEVCSRLCFAVYQDGSRVKYENQKAGDGGFGTFALKLDAGTYQLLVVGHSGATNPSTTQPTKIQFTNPTASNGTGFTDTFYYYGTLVVGSDGAQLDVSMQRATAMFRLKTTDVKPDQVKSFQFYYEGGSGTLDATTGYGCVNSKQTVFIETGSDLTGQPLEFDLYTFPHEETDQVKFTVRAFGDDGRGGAQELYTKEFDVTMKRNCITRYTGEFFTADAPDPKGDPDNPQPGEPASNVIQVDPAWGDIFDYTF